MWWQWHQMYHKQIIYTLLRRDNYTSISSLTFYRLDALPATQPTASKHWKNCKNDIVDYWSVIIIMITDDKTFFNGLFQDNLGRPIPLIILAHTQPFYGSLDFLWDNLCEPIPEETFTHSHLLWSSVIPYLLPLSITNHCILPYQFMYLIFHNLSPSFLWSTSWPGTLHFILHTFLHPIIVFFSQHMPIPSQPVLL